MKEGGGKEGETIGKCDRKAGRIINRLRRRTRNRVWDVVLLSRRSTSNLCEHRVLSKLHPFHPSPYVMQSQLLFTPFDTHMHDGILLNDLFPSPTVDSTQKKQLFRSAIFLHFGGHRDQLRTRERGKAEGERERRRLAGIHSRNNQVAFAILLSPTLPVS